TFEYDATHAEVARRNLARAGLDKITEVRSRRDARGAMLKGVTKGAPCPSARMLPPGKTDAVSCGGWLQDSPYWPATTVRGCAATCSPV
ncbi:hypothetical protein ABZ672_46090, partial [Streptomyces mirabilis]